MSRVLSSVLSVPWTGGVFIGSRVRECLHCGCRRWDRLHSTSFMSDQDLGDLEGLDQETLRRLRSYLEHPEQQPRIYGYDWSKGYILIRVIPSNTNKKMIVPENSNNKMHE